MRLPIVTLVVAASVLIGGWSNAARADEQSAGAVTRDYAGAVIKEAGIKPQFGEKVPLDAQFVNADGEAVRLGDCFDGKPVILHLVYYECPMLCKLSADGLLNTLGVMSLKPGRDFTVVTLSFDPTEGPELSQQARKLAIVRCGKDAVEGGWHFLTGEADAIRAVTDKVGFKYVYDETTKQYAHASGIFVLTPDGTISRYLGGINFAPRDVRFALVEASDGKVGNMADQMLMLCYMYDPTVGRYGFAIITIVRVAGILTVATMATGIIWMLRRERRQKVSQLDLALKPSLDAGWKV
jgi:protein SCO1/2